jgi:hypothetical protein
MHAFVFSAFRASLLALSFFALSSTSLAKDQGSSGLDSIQETLRVPHSDPLSAPAQESLRGPESLLDDIRILRSDHLGLELILEPRLLADELSDQPPRLRVAHSFDDDRPRRTLRVALPVGSTASLEILGQASVLLKGQLAQAGFVGKNPEALFQMEHKVWGDLEVVEILVDLLRKNGPQSSELLSHLHLQIHFDAASQATKGEGYLENFSGTNTSRHSQSELAACLLNPTQAQQWLRPRPQRLLADPITEWDGHTFLQLTLSEAGLYSITPSLLSSKGLDPSTLDPATIKLYGYPEDHIPDSPADARNSLFTPIERPLIREINADAGFSGSERLLFYANGTTGPKVRQDGSMTRFEQLYSETSSFLLLVGGVEAGLIMPALDVDPQGVNPEPAQTRWWGAVNENKNLAVLSARAWYGDRFQQAGDVGEYVFQAPPFDGLMRVEQDYYPNYGGMPSEWFQFSVNGVAVGEPFHPHLQEMEFAWTHGGGELRLELELVGSSGLEVFLEDLQIMVEAAPVVQSGHVDFLSSGTPGLYAFEIGNHSNGSYTVDTTWPDSLRYTQASHFVDRISRISSSSAFGQVRAYSTFAPSELRTPASVELVEMPDLKSAAGSSELIVIAPALFAEAALDLVQFKNDETQTTARLVLLEDIYLEFNAGTTDPGAIRNFLRHEYVSAESPAMAVLFVGNGHYDYMGRIQGSYPMRFPAWYNTTFPNASMVDDFFVRLVTSTHLDMCYGRLPANSLTDVENAVEKIKVYERGEDFGFWRNRMLFVADDEHADNGRVSHFETTHSRDTEQLVRNFIPDQFDTDRLYLFDYPSIYNPEIRVWEKPLAEQRLLSSLNEGAVLVSFMGHGNNTTWTHEYVFNASKHFPLLTGTRPSFYVAATCSWAEIDLPVGLAFPQQLINMPVGGSIGVVAATRKTSGGSNENFAIDLLPVFFAHFSTGTPQLSLAEAVRIAKNAHYDTNRRKYVYLGDPTLLPAFPKGEGLVQGIQSQGEFVDTLLSQELAVLFATTYDGSNPTQESVIDGLSTLVVHEAPVQRHHQFDPYSSGGQHNLSIDYVQAGPRLFRGDVHVEQGSIEASFVLPSDLSGSSETGRLRAYYQGEQMGGDLTDGLVYYDGLHFALNPDPPVDHDAPLVQLYFNSANWREDDLVAPNSRLVARLSDESGINLTGEIGHRIELEIDGGLPFDLSPSFVYDVDSWREGEASFSLPSLDSGEHTASVRVFDNHNNPGYAEIIFNVLGEVHPQLRDLVNYPNPVSEETQFTFRLEGLQIDAPLEMELRVFTLRGRRIAQERLALSGGSDLMWSEEWRPRDDLGNPLGRGVYFYRILLPVPATSYSATDEQGNFVAHHIAASSVSAKGRMVVQ